MIIFFSSVKLVYFNQFFCLLCVQTVSDVGPFQTICWKKILYKCWTAHKLDVKLQSLCGSGFSLIAMRMLAKPYHFRVNWPTTSCENKDGVHFFAFNFECHNRYNKLLLCNSENGDIAWCSKNNFQNVFFLCFSLKKNKKPALPKIQ